MLVAGLKEIYYRKRATKTLCTTGYKNVADTTNLFPFKMGLKMLQINFERNPIKDGSRGILTKHSLQIKYKIPEMPEKVHHSTT